MTTSNSALVKAHTRYINVACVCMYVYANTRVHVHVRRGRWLRGDTSPSVRPLPAISYRRDVTDFTGRRANEKLVGCEVARGGRDYVHLLSSPPLPPRSHPSRRSRPSRHPQDTLAGLAVAFIRHSDRQPSATSSEYPAREISLASITGSRLSPCSWSRSPGELLCNRNASTLLWNFLCEALISK